FFSKDEILWKTFSAKTLGIGAVLPGSASKALWFIGAVTALLTAIYMTRLMVMTFWGDERFRDTHSETDKANAHAGEEPHDAQTPDARDQLHHQPGEHVHGVHVPYESPWIMTIPLIVLAVLSTFGGLIGIPYAISSVFSHEPVNIIEKTLDPVLRPEPA